MTSPASFRLPASGNPAKSLMLILHGWGADGANLIDIADYLAGDFPDTHFIAPNAPEICDVNPYGYQWFSLSDRNPNRLNEGIRKAAASFNSYLDATLAELKLDESQLILGGFSQGTMLALHVALRRTKQAAGVLGFSGAMLDADTLPAELKSKPSTCLIHGVMDDVVPFAAMEHAKMVLTQHGVPVETHSRPYLGHSIDMEGLAIAKGFLKARLG